MALRMAAASALKTAAASADSLGMTTVELMAPSAL
jgi:hypothetical protein